MVTWVSSVRDKIKDMDVDMNIVKGIQGQG